MRILFISEYISINIVCGAKKVARSHYRSLCELAGEENVDVMAITWRNQYEKDDPDFTYLKSYDSSWGMIRNMIQGNYNLISNEVKGRILKRINEKAYDIIYFDDRNYGTVIRDIKRQHPALPVVIFFHGISQVQMRQRVKQSFKEFLKIPQHLQNIRNERMAIAYSDTKILLNKRDEEALQQYYHVPADAILPLSLPDQYIEGMDPEPLMNAAFNILFVGVHFWPNVSGISWFVREVLPKLTDDVQLYIVGKGMEVLKKEEPFKGNPRVTIVGFVDSLNPWYEGADLVVGPIFEGDGMKTKTTEAFMFGKHFLGTDESLCGFQDVQAYHCKNAKAFVSKIEAQINKAPDKFNPTTRRKYLEHYSTTAEVNLFKETFNRLLNGRS